MEVILVDGRPDFTAGSPINCYNMGVPDRLKSMIRDVPDFPKPGIIFKDITPLLSDPCGLSLAVELMANQWRDDRQRYDRPRVKRRRDDRRHDD